MVPAPESNTVNLDLATEAVLQSSSQMYVGAMQATVPQTFAMLFSLFRDELLESPQPQVARKCDAPAATSEVRCDHLLGTLLGVQLVGQGPEEAMCTVQATYALPWWQAALL